LTFQICDYSGDWNEVAGIYMFCSANAQGQWQSLYIGQASSFKDRLCAHEQWTPAVRLGATHAHAIVVPTQSERDRLEKMLIAEMNPPLNVQLRAPSTVTLGAAARGLPVVGPTRSNALLGLLGTAAGGIVRNGR